MPVTQEQFRQLALALPDCIEGAHQGHADYRCAGRVFATLPAADVGMVKVPPATQRELVAAHGEVFTPAAGAWGKAGCTLVRIAVVDRAVLRDAMAEAWQFAVAMAAARERKK